MPQPFQGVHDRDDKRTGADPACRYRLGRNHTTREESIGKPEMADPQAASTQASAGLTNQKLGAAASDINHQQLLIKHWQRLENTQVYESGLFRPRDHIDGHASLRRPFDEDMAIV